MATKPSGYVYEDDKLFAPVEHGGEFISLNPAPHERIWNAWAKQSGIEPTIQQFVGYDTAEGAQALYQAVENPEYAQWKASKKAEGYEIGMKDIPGIKYTKDFFILQNGQPAFDTIRLKTGTGVLEGIGDLAKQLAPMAVMAITANPALAASVGASVNTALNLGLSTTAATSLGSAVISSGITAMKGGDLGDVLVSGVTAGAGSQLSSAIGAALPSFDNPVIDNAIKQAVTNTATEGIKVVLGQEGNLEQAFTSGLLSGATSATLDQLKGSSELLSMPKPVQSAVIAGASAALAGKNADGVLKASMMAALSTAAKENLKLTDAQRTALVKDAYKQVVGGTEPSDARALEIYRQAEADIGEARTIYEMTTGLTLSDDALLAAAQSGDPFKYLDDLYTTSDEARAIWRNTVGTEPTEEELRSIIGLDSTAAQSAAELVAQNPPAPPPVAEPAPAEEQPPFTSTPLDESDLTEEDLRDIVASSLKVEPISQEDADEISQAQSETIQQERAAQYADPTKWPESIKGTIAQYLSSNAGKGDGVSQLSDGTYAVRTSNDTTYKFSSDGTYLGSVYSVTSDPSPNYVAGDALIGAISEPLSYVAPGYGTLASEGVGGIGGAGGAETEFGPIPIDQEIEDILKDTAPTSQPLPQEEETPWYEKIGALFSFGTPPENLEGKLALFGPGSTGPEGDFGVLAFDSPEQKQDAITWLDSVEDDLPDPYKTTAEELRKIIDEAPAPEPAPEPSPAPAPEPAPAPPSITTGQVQQIVNEAIGNIQFPAGITKEDVAAEIKKYAEANPGLSTLDVTDAVAAELKKLPAYATPADVTTALETALAGYATQANVNAATKTLQDAIDAAQAGNTTRFDEIDTAIQALRDAGLTEAQVKSVVDASAEGLSTQFKDALDAAVAGNTQALGTLKTDLETKIGDVQTALETALGEQGSAFGERVTALMEQGQSYQEAVNAALQALGTDIGSLGEDVATKLAGLESALGERIGGLESQLGDVETRLAEAIQTAKDIGLEGDQALEAAINSVAADLGTTKDALLEQIGTTEQALREDFATQLAGVTTELGNVESRLTDAIATAEAAGLSRDQAIEAALNTVAADLGTTKEGLLSQLGTVESTLRSEIEASQAALGEQLTDVETRLKGAIADAEAAGLSRDEAIQSAVDEVASDLGTTREALLEQIGATETTLRADLEAGLGLVGEQVAGVEQRLTEAIAAAEAAGLSRDEAIQAAVDAVASDLGTTREGLLEQLGTTEEALRAEFTSGLAGVETALGEAKQAILDQMAAYEAAGIERDQALDLAITGVAQDLGTTKDDILSRLGITEEALRTEFQAGQEALGEQLTGVEGRLTQAIAQAEAAGLSRDEAIQTAVDAVAADLGTTREDLLTQLGTTEAALRTEFQAGQTALGEQLTAGFGDLRTALDEAEARIQARADQYEATGLARDQALQQAIADVAADLGTTAQNLEQQLFSAQTALSEQITGVQTGLQQQIQDVATVLGKPAQAVTQADIDLVNQMIQGQVQTDLTYDANRDGVIDQNDVAFLTSITTGTEPPEFPAGTRWAPTGVYGQIAGLGQDLTRQLEEQELARIAREQAAAEEAERAAQGRFQQQQKQQRVQQFMGMLTQPGALQQKVQVKSPEVMKLEQLYGGLYDPTAGLFRTPQQEQFFASPYGNYFDGGEVTEDELLAIVRG